MSNNTMGSAFGGTMCTVCAVMTGVTGTAKTFSATPVGTAAVIDYCIKGKAYQRAVYSGASLPTVDAITGAAFTALAANQGAVYVLCLTGGADSTPSVAAGTIVGLDASGTFIAYPEMPALPDTLCPFAYIVVKNGATGSAWTFATGNWDATGVTATPIPVMMLPDRPQIS